MKRRFQTFRAFSLCAIFWPDDGNNSARAEDILNFQQFVLDARSHLQKIKEKELKQKLTGLENLIEADRKVGPLLREVFAGRADAESAGKEIRQLVPDADTKKALVEFYKAAFTAAQTPEDPATRDEKIRRSEIDVARGERRLKANKAINKGFRILSDGITAGDTDAAKDLADAAIEAVRLLGLAEMYQPNVFGKIAKGKMVWPILATGESGWEREAGRRVADLGVGDDLVVFKARFRKARGYDENLPGRRWAKAAVRTIEETQLRCLRIGLLTRDFKSPAAFADFCMEKGWDIRPSPEWQKKACALGSFTQASRDQWAATIRDMIRVQMPDFHTCPEWQNQRNAAKARGCESKGIIQNRILDDICDALKSIAPEKRGDVYGNSTAEVPQ